MYTEQKKFEKEIKRNWIFHFDRNKCPDVLLHTQLLSPKYYFSMSANNNNNDDDDGNDDGDCEK